MRDTLHTLTVLAVEQPTPVRPDGMEGVDTGLGYLAWGLTIACVIGVIVTAILMALQHKHGEGGKHAGSLGWVMGAAIIGSSAGPLVTALL